MRRSAVHEAGSTPLAVAEGESLPSYAAGPAREGRRGCGAQSAVASGRRAVPPCEGGRSHVSSPEAARRSEVLTSAVGRYAVMAGDGPAARENRTAVSLLPWGDATVNEPGLSGENRAGAGGRTSRSGMSDAVVGPVDSVLEEAAGSSGPASSPLGDSFVDLRPNSLALLCVATAPADPHDIPVDSADLIQAGSVGDPVEILGILRIVGKGNEVGSGMGTSFRRHTADADHGRQGPRRAHAEYRHAGERLATARADTLRVGSDRGAPGPRRGLPSRPSGPGEKRDLVHGRLPGRTRTGAK